ncbi:MAG TPA: hypothetical protein VFI90_16575, partial [Rubrobacter sp.]|nr:hypothetical protein [Rubrobacter sp.]
EITTVRQTLSETFGNENGSDVGVTILCLNKIDLLDEGRIQELRREFPDAAMISALSGSEDLLVEIYNAIASERERIEVLIPHAEYAAASHLYGLAEIHAQENTPSGLWMDVSIPRSATARYAPYRTPNNTSQQ